MPLAVCEYIFPSLSWVRTVHARIFFQIVSCVRVNFSFAVCELYMPVYFSNCKLCASCCVRVNFSFAVCELYMPVYFSNCKLCASRCVRLNFFFAVCELYMPVYISNCKLCASRCVQTVHAGIFFKL